MTTNEALRLTAHLLTALANRLEKDQDETDDEDLRFNLRKLVGNIDGCRDMAIEMSGPSLSEDSESFPCSTALDNVFGFGFNFGPLLAKLERPNP